MFNVRKLFRLRTGVSARHLAANRVEHARPLEGGDVALRPPLVGQSEIAEAGVLQIPVGDDVEIGAVAEVAEAVADRHQVDAVGPAAEGPGAEGG